MDKLEKENACRKKETNYSLDDAEATVIVGHENGKQSVKVRDAEGREFRLTCPDNLEISDIVTYHTSSTAEPKTAFPDTPLSYESDDSFLFLRIQGLTASTTLRAGQAAKTTRKANHKRSPTDHPITIGAKKPGTSPGETPIDTQVWRKQGRKRRRHNNHRYRNLDTPTTVPTTQRERIRNKPKSKSQFMRENIDDRHRESSFCFNFLRKFPSRE